MAISREDASHLLKRVGFGAKPAEVDALAALPTWADAVDRVLDTSQAPPNPGPSPLLHDPNSYEYMRWVKATEVWIDRMRTAPVPIVEKMALFWHGHFTSSRDKVKMPLMWDQINLYRTHALGDYHELAQRMAVHPAMLMYLDNSTNIAKRPNENFGRELMELFLMGNGTFTENDVVAMSRAWTGHGLNSGETRYEWHAGDHDNGQKSLFGITKNWNGPDTITEILKRSKADLSARFLASKIWSYFAGTQAPPAVLDALASEFRSSGLSIRTLVRAILLRPEFRSPDVRIGRVRSPIEWLVACTRVLGVTAADAHPEWYLLDMGQEPFTPPNVSGWRSNGAWVSTSGVWARASFVSRLRWVATGTDYPYRQFFEIQKRSVAEIAQTGITAFELAEPSTNTRRVLEQWATKVKGPGHHGWSAAPNLVLVTALSPDFQMA